jgi:hypothetical protein
MLACAAGDQAGSCPVEEVFVKPEKDWSPWEPILVMVVLGIVIIWVSVLIVRFME